MPEKRGKAKGSGKKVGRPPKYDEERFPVVARAMARLGATDKEVADALGVALATLKTWKKIPEFVAALKEGKALADAHVEDGLYQRAIGYEYREVKVVQEANEVGVAIGGGDDGKATLMPAVVIRTETVSKQRAPDVTAQIFWLKNRKPEEWRDVQQRELSGKDGGPISLTHETLLRKLLPEAAGGGEKAPAESS